MASWIYRAVIFLFFLFLQVNTSFAGERLPNEFDGHKLGDKLPQNFELIQEMPMGFGQTVPEIIYKAHDDTNQDFYGIPVKQVEYGFCKNKLSSIYIYFGNVNLANVAQQVAGKIGMTPKEIKGQYPNFWWKGKDANLTVFIGVENQGTRASIETKIYDKPCQ